MSITLFTKACHFAAFKHRHQRRKNVNIPYINHPLEVANILASAGVEDVATLCAAVLHDTLEDT
jgi:(p)ppGpp synthase/HD superfamily hydrolase